MNDKKEYLQRLSDCVVNMEEDDVAEVAKSFIDTGYPALDGVMDGLVDGMNRASQLFDDEEYFVSDLLLCSDAMYAGLDVFRPHIPEEYSSKTKPRAIIGVVQGDTHDIGKNLVKIMLETAGYEMYDLGRDVPVEDFITKAKEINASLICLSTLMTTTMANMAKVINRLQEENMRDKVKVMIGGAPISQAFANKIGADGYSTNAIGAVKLAKKLVPLESSARAS